MRLTKILLCLVAMAGSAFASIHDVFFRMSDSGKFLVKLTYDSPWVSSEGTPVEDLPGDNVRIRVIDPPAGNGLFGFELQRPFLVLDGIYLDVENNRTLSEFMEEAEQFGLVSVLKELGYTPVLVQFAETVSQGLETNSTHFKNLLQFMNDNPYFGFQNKAEDGFIVMGISQGGILGRYGSYLYDISRPAGSAPIRLYASLDSPHQGAIMPKGLHYTINFWAAHSSDAGKFRDLIEGAGASELLLYQPVGKDDGTVKDYYSADGGGQRFLFGKYREAANYKGFPVVLISQGQMKGKSADHKKKFFDLNRKVTKLGGVFGRAVSSFSAPDMESGEIAHNRMYRFDSIFVSRDIVGTTEYDFIQGSTYPFAKTMYSSLRSGFVSEIPKEMHISFSDYFGNEYNVSLTGSWDKDTLYQANSTFIPTTSAMDMLCGGELSIGVPCSFKESHVGFPFENPKGRSTADAAYAVDPTHPRYNEAISGRHIELPGVGDKQDMDVLVGMQTDVWRIFCEIAKRDYDASSKSFRNSKLSGVFDPSASCMDITKMPALIKNSGIVQRRKFGYARYDYNEKATESKDSVRFKVPAGWHKVAVFDNGGKIQEGSTFEVEVIAGKSSSGWMKAELLLTTTKAGTGQIQMREITVPMDGDRHTLRWAMPETKGALTNYRWFRLVLNSSGSTVSVMKPRLVYASMSKQSVEYITNPIIFPNNKLAIRKVGENASVSLYEDALGSGQNLKFNNIGDFAFYDLGGAKNLSQFKTVKIQYWPGSCGSTKVYFDSFVNGAVSLANGNSVGGFVEKTIPLENIVNTNFTQDNGISASRFVLRGTSAGERCLIHSIILD
ncbi:MULTISPECIES: hypothetical protein [unclassified Fibrobacter]|uniref:hypothetical protein n=1 Tax=unclassified Fibrobacter TaxID=2634177 RepID=UPI000D78DA86|nr:MULTISPECIES: hypothetical protein [unclassified Fibrobacter]PWJ62777.1 hypothetical protein BGX12_12066 [Fibrobacter sp. UWR4]PZW63732.1 hypothetical protein C8E88_104112 [Fibrobacter sp. UWR1]